MARWRPTTAGEAEARDVTTPELGRALAAMGAEDVVTIAFERDLELLCRTAGVRPTASDVTGPARITIMFDAV